jgi:hypothetical protein
VVILIVVSVIGRVRTASDGQWASRCACASESAESCAMASVLVYGGSGALGAEVVSALVRAGMVSRTHVWAKSNR